MTPKQTVVSIDGAAPLKHQGMSIPVKAFCDLAEKELKLLMRAMFDGADDSLFKLSDKASSNEQQERYFNAMREVRLKRRQMEARFFEGYRKTFNDLSAGISVAARQQDKVSMESLSLVQNEELEERVALETMSNKATSLNKTSLSYLNQRLAYLLSRDNMLDADNPVAPINLCDYFSDCLQLLDLDIEARLLVYKLFDQYVMARLYALYEDLDKLLITHGALPRLEGAKKSKEKGVSQDASHAERTTTASAAPGALKPIFRSLQKLMEQVSSEQADTMVAAPTYQGPTQPTAKICEVLSSLQVPSANDEQELEGWKQFDVREHVRGAMKASAPGGRALPLARKDNDAINLIAMLFEFILEDRNIIPEIRAVLARLQLPLVKLALQDKKFFDQKSHPARTLLNALASAAIGFNHVSDRFQERLKFKIEEVVTRICSEFDSASDLFDMLLADFQVFQEKEARRVELVTQRLQSAEEGKAKTERARDLVKDTLNKLSASYQPLPEFIETLLSEAWSKVLFLNALKDGAEGDAWKTSVFIIEQLLWTISGEHNRSSRPVLLKVIPVVQKQVRKGLNDVSYNPYDSSRLLKELESLQIAMLKEASTKEGTAQQAEDAKSWLTQSSNPAEKLRSSSEELSTSETMAAIDQVLVQQNSETNMQALKPYLSKVDEFCNGSWFQFHKGGEETRTKLAASLPKLDKYIFVNHAGMKVHECNKVEFAELLKSKVMKYIDNGSVFDRALKSVVKSLRSSGN
jgi:hypothetical protein